MNSGPDSEQEKAKLAGEIEDKLRDPDSVRFRWLPLRLDAETKQGGYYYCFSYNAKNQYGGYGGYTPVLAYVAAEDGRGRTEVAAWQPELTHMTGRVCAGYGYPAR